MKQRKHRIIMSITLLACVTWWGLPVALAAGIERQAEVNIQLAPHAEISVIRSIGESSWTPGILYTDGIPGSFTGEPETRWAEGELSVTTNANVTLVFSAETYPTLNGIEFPINQYYVQQWDPPLASRWHFSKDEDAAIRGKCLVGTTTVFRVFAEGTIPEEFWDIPAGTYHGTIQVTVTEE